MVDSNHLPDAEAAEVLQRLDVAEARDGIEQLDWGGRKPCQTHTSSILQCMFLFHLQVSIFKKNKLDMLTGNTTGRQPLASISDKSEVTVPTAAHC